MSKIIKVNGEQPFDSILLIMNGTHHILSFSTSVDQSHASFEASLRGLARRLVQFGFDGPRVLYVDQCCRDGPFVTTILPSLIDARGIAEGTCLGFCVWNGGMRACV